MATESARRAPSVRSYSILIEPVITEKSSLVGEAGRTLVFRVDRRASKDEIKSAVERIFKVGVDSVRTCNFLGKPKRAGTSAGRRAAFKKAYVTLQEGQTIDVIEGV